MDNTKEYILMCEKAVEIQEQWVPICGDVYDSRSRTFKGVKILKEPAGLNRYKYNHVWLPRQDQLQDIMGQGTGITYIVGIKSWIDEPSSNLAEVVIKAYCSMEQLWLAFVMKVKYNKTWNGSDWIKDKQNDE